MRTCQDCKYWKKDYGIMCFNGWTGWDKDDGFCHFEPKVIPKKEKDFCSHFQNRYGEEEEVKVRRGSL